MVILKHNVPISSVDIRKPNQLELIPRLLNLNLRLDDLSQQFDPLFHFTFYQVQNSLCEFSVVFKCVLLELKLRDSFEVVVCFVKVFLLDSEF